MAAIIGDFLGAPGFCCNIFISISSCTSSMLADTSRGNALTSKKCGYVLVNISRAGPNCNEIINNLISFTKIYKLK